MADNIPVTVDSSSIIPMIGDNESQIIFQRHCSYDREKGKIIPESAATQQSIAEKFISALQQKYSIDELKNTYFLFDSSNTFSTGDFKRCVATTDIAMNAVKAFFEANNIPLSHIINLNENANYNNQVRENKHLTEPKMFTDSTGYLEYLKEKHNGINKDFWIDFESDLSKEKRLELQAEGPDEIVNRAVRYVNVLQRYARYYHTKMPNSRLIIWCGTHYDLISPLVKQKVLNYEKSDLVSVDYCGGMSFIINESNEINTIVNGVTYPFDSQYKKQPRQHS